MLKSLTLRNLLRVKVMTRRITNMCYLDKTFDFVYNINEQERIKKGRQGKIGVEWNFMSKNLKTWLFDMLFVLKLKTLPTHQRKNNVWCFDGISTWKLRKRRWINDKRTKKLHSLTFFAGDLNEKNWDNEFNVCRPGIHGLFNHRT